MQRLAAISKSSAGPVNTISTTSFIALSLEVSELAAGDSAMSFGNQIMPLKK